MKLWLTRQDAPIEASYVKRFDPLHWTIDFPLGTIASTVSAIDGHGLSVKAEFLRLGDLVGLIFESEDRRAHPAHARQPSVDYTNCTLAFRWQSSGLMPLEAVNGPTLTIEGKDLSGAQRSWFVRLWNYAEGSPTNALVTLDFNQLDGGFSLPADADRVNPKQIERMFLSLVPPDYIPDSMQIRSSPAVAELNLSQIRCGGSGSVLRINDAIVPDHRLGVATAYDDLYDLPPDRIVDAIERLGFRGPISHYIGMSHFFALGGDGKLNPSRPFNSAAEAWHRDFARAAKARGFDVVWALSFELLDSFCPDAWKQRAFDGAPAQTAWNPPSSLVSPANAQAIAFLTSVAVRLVEISRDAGLGEFVQIGEPWWWVTPTGAMCLYDAAARASFGGNPVEVANVHGPLSTQQMALLDAAGSILASATASITAAMKAASPEARTSVLIYLPTILDPAAPELKRANLPQGWAHPAFDVLQIEDYEWVTGGRDRDRASAYSEVQTRLGYEFADQHYYAGFAASQSSVAEWRSILAAANEARGRGVAETIIWALPQILRDGVTLFGEEKAVAPFDDVDFPIEIGAEAVVSPGFSTNVVTSASGREVRNVNWQQARMRFDAGPGVRGDGELETLIAFFRARRGPAVAFRFRDPFDHSSNGMSATPAATDQLLGAGDGARTAFDLVKDYDAGEQRRITRPVTGTVRVAIDGVEQITGWTLEPMGVVQFATPPSVEAQVTAGFMFDVPVRFAEDRLEVNRASFRAGEAPSVPLVEVRES